MAKPKLEAVDDQTEDQTGVASMVDDEGTGIPSVIEYAEDVDDAEAPEPLPDGDYPATVEKVEMKVGATSGKNYLAVTFRISTDEFPADFDVNNAPEGLVISYNRLSPDDTIAARFRMKKFIRAIGATGGRQINLMEWVGLNATLHLSHREYEGVPQNDIKSVKAA